MEIRLLSLWQPWASLIAAGYKQIETRHWGTDYRGLVAIHAGKRKIDADGKTLLKKIDAHLEDLPLGAIVAVARLSDCSVMAGRAGEEYCYIRGGHKLTPYSMERVCGNWQPGRYAWVLQDVRSIKPIYTAGKQGFPFIRDQVLLRAIQEATDV